MTINRTTLLDLPLPVTGTESGVWGDVVNNGLSQYIDISVAGSLSLSADSDTNLSSTEGDASATNIGSTTAQYAILRCTGARTATRNINAPAWAISGGTLTNYSKIYIVVNETTGSQNIVLRATNSATPTYTTGVTIVPGERAVCAWNGSDFVKVGGAAGGSTTQVQYNNAGVFAGSANFTFDGSNVGIGVTPTASSNTGILQNQGGILFAFSNTFQDLSQNAYYNGGYKYTNSNFATLYRQNGGTHQWFNSASGTAGNAITFTQAMTLDASGRLGIGTSSPNVALDVVSGSVNTVGDSLTDQTSSVTGPNRAFSTHVGVLNVATNTAAGIDVGGSIGFGGRWTGTTQAGFALIKGAKESASTSYASYLAFYTRPDSAGMSERMRIDSSGNVGIGTSSISNKLEVNGSARFYTAAQGDISITHSGLISSITAAGSVGLALGTNNAERMRITSAGNVGIGTTSPSTKLDIVGPSTGSALADGVRVSTSIGFGASYGDGLSFYNSNPSYLAQLAGIYPYTSGFSQKAGNLIFATNNGTTYAERMRIDYSGNVGIGTSSPSYRFDVSGASASGIARFANAWGDGTNPAILVDGTGSDGRLVQIKSGGTRSWPLLWVTASTTDVLVVNGDSTIKTAGTISVGGATPSTSGAGITFPATQSASSDANTLDDYEEGTWTPSVGGNATYDNQEGKYTKVGRVVTVSMFLSVNTIGTGSTSTISGLPFQADDYSSGSIAYWNQAAASYVYMAPLTTTGSSSITFYGATAAASGISALSPIGSGTDFRLTITYFV